MSPQYPGGFDLEDEGRVPDGYLRGDACNCEPQARLRLCVLYVAPRATPRATHICICIFVDMYLDIYTYIYLHTYIYIDIISVYIYRCRYRHRYRLQIYRYVSIGHGL